MMPALTLLFRTVLATALVLGGSVGVAHATDPAVRILTESFPPFNYHDEAGQLTGQSTAVVRALQHELQQHQPITLLPWDEAYQHATAQPNVALYSTARTPERESRFAWVGPIGAYQHAFYARADQARPIRSLEDARQARAIAVVNHSARHDFLRQHGFGNIRPVATDVAAYLALASGEVDLVLGSSDSVALAAEQAGLGPFSIAEAYAVRDVPLYLAFSPGTPATEVQRWQHALDQIKADGRYAAILAQWGHRLSLTPGTHTGQLMLDGDTVAQLLAAYLDSRLTAQLAPLQALANTAEARSGQWAAIKPLLQEREDNEGDGRYWFALPDGRYFTTVDGEVKANLRDRGYFADLMAGELVEGELVLSRSTGRQAAVVAAPILHHDRVIGALGASIYLADLADEVDRNVALPNDTWLMAIDPRGVVVLHPDSAWIGQSAHALAAPLATAAQRPSGATQFDAEGRRYRAVWATAPLSGWRAVVARASGPAESP